MTILLDSATSPTKIIKTIFHWSASCETSDKTFSPHAHCLLRIFFNLSQQQAVVIASQLNSNQGNTGIYYGFIDLVNQVLNDFSFLKILLPNVIWLTQYGAFSRPRSFENLKLQDEFSQEYLNFNSLGQATEIYTEQVLTQAQVKELLGSAPLEPVDELLAELGHDNQN